MSQNVQIHINVKHNWIIRQSSDKIWKNRNNGINFNILNKICECVYAVYN